MIERITAAVLAIALTITLAGCAQQSDLASSSGSSANKTIVEIAPEDRTEPILFAGELESGVMVDSRDWLGSVVVVNFWYASCPPCRAEAPDLESLYEQYGPEGVQFIGVNVRDTAPTASSFAAKFGIAYPSIIDSSTAEVQLAFAGQIAPNAVPTTIVLDREGRPAARILGRIPTALTLGAIIDTVLAEDPTE